MTSPPQRDRQRVPRLAMHDVRVNSKFQCCYSGCFSLCLSAGKHEYQQWSWETTQGPNKQEVPRIGQPVPQTGTPETKCMCGLEETGYTVVNRVGRYCLDGTAKGFQGYISLCLRLETPEIQCLCHLQVNICL